LTQLLHVFPDEDPFGRRVNLNEFDYLRSSSVAQAALAEQYVGLPFED
jgi:p-hydroxybenzoate 3-monooxygenase